MASETEIYGLHLLTGAACTHYVLLRSVRPEYHNWSQDSENEAAETAESMQKVLLQQAQRHLSGCGVHAARIIGEFHDFPVGDNEFAPSLSGSGEAKSAKDCF